MPKKVSLQRVDKSLATLESLVAKGNFDFGEFVDLKKTTSHQEIVELSRRLKNVADALSEQEADYIKDHILEQVSPLIKVSDGNDDRLHELVEKALDVKEKVPEVNPDIATDGDKINDAHSYQDRIKPGSEPNVRL